MAKTNSVGTLEKMATSVFGFRHWFVKVGRLSMILAKGSYRLGERRRLFVKLGEEVYDRINRGELVCDDLNTTVQQLNRLTKKVKIEEMLIHKIRFGAKKGQKKRKKKKAKRRITSSDTPLNQTTI